MPLNSIALLCFFKYLSENKAVLKQEIVKSIKDLKSDIPSKSVCAFAKFFGLNLIYRKDVVLNFHSSSPEKSSQQRIIDVKYFQTFSGENPRNSWKEYPAKTLAAHLIDEEGKIDFIYFGGHECVLFFELIVTKRVCTSIFQKLDDTSRLEMILNMISRWFGFTVSNGAKEVLSSKDYLGDVEYIIVSSQTVDDHFHGSHFVRQFPSKHQSLASEIQNRSDNRKIK